ncbi:MAG TPA: HAMP domain-containing sensor histidine kinase [Lacipirellula sp.]
MTGFTASVSESEPTFEARLEQAKLEAMKELAYGASHEINNPLANISARAQMLLRDECDPERRRALEAINYQALRAHEMISDLMLFARPPRLDRQPLEFAPLVRQVLDELRIDCERRGIATAFEAADEPTELIGDAVQLAVAVKAVIANAVEAIGREGRIEASLDSDQHAVRLTVRDDGPGIPPEVRPHIFEPFFSGREAGRGLGFGLSKAWRIVTEHGGRIRVESGADGGATFIVELPASGGGG